jgi:hypothetical protein
MAVDGDEPSWSVIIEVDKGRCAAMGTLSSLCLFAADVDVSVLCLQAAMYSPGS